MTDHLWARVKRWWSQDPSQRGPLHDSPRLISAKQARQLLDSITGLSFSNPTHIGTVFNALDELMWWSEAEPDDELAVEWIICIYSVHPLSLESRHGY
jgi:hypothetical protein